VRSQEDLQLFPELALAGPRVSGQCREQGPLEFPYSGVVDESEAAERLSRLSYLARLQQLKRLSAFGEVRR